MTRGTRFVVGCLRLAPVTPVAAATFAPATIRNVGRRSHVDLPPIRRATLLLAPLGFLGERRLPAGFAELPLQPHRPARRIENFEKPVMRGFDCGIRRRVAELVAKE